jgi:hypothetical protein
MVTTVRKMVTITEAERIIREAKTPDEAVERLRKLTKRQPKPTAPEGGISLREASRKYEIPIATLSYWVTKNNISVLKRTPNWLYIDESSLIKYISHDN